MTDEIKRVLEMANDKMETSTDDDGWFTMRELQEETGMSNKRALSMVRSLLESGDIDSGGRVIRTNISGVQHPVPAYRIAKKGVKK